MTISCGPAQAEIDHASSLIICPDGRLQGLPFAALMPASGHFLIEDRPIQTIASLSVYKNIQEQRFPTNPRLVVLDNFENDDSSSSASSSSNPMSGSTATSSKLVRDTASKSPAGLPGKRAPHEQPISHKQQIIHEWKTFSSSAIVLPDTQATIANLKTYGKTAGVLFLLCHGKAKKRNPFDSCLELTPDGHRDDGQLTGIQVLGMKLKANPGRCWERARAVWARRPNGRGYRVWRWLFRLRAQTTW